MRCATNAKAGSHGPPCFNEAATGRKFCTSCLAKAREYTKRSRAAMIREEEPKSGIVRRPDWMDNPALLPKKPPGGRP